MTSQWRGGLAAAVLTIAIILPAPAQAQSVEGSRSTFVDAVLQDLAMVEQKIMALAEAIPEDAYGWRPAEGVRSVGDVLVHIAAGNYFLPTMSGTDAPESTGIRAASYETVQAYEARTVSKAETIDALRSSFAHVRSALQQADDSFLDGPMTMFGTEMTGTGFWVLSATHLHEHLGQLIAYARSNGIVPPWSG